MDAEHEQEIKRDFCVLRFGALFGTSVNIAYPDRYSFLGLTCEGGTKYLPFNR